MRKKSTYNVREGRPVPGIEMKVKEGHNEEFIQTRPVTPGKTGNNKFVASCPAKLRVPSLGNLMNK
jgi:hypothetical protein